METDFWKGDPPAVLRIARARKIHTRLFETGLAQSLESQGIRASKQRASEIYKPFIDYLIQLDLEERMRAMG